MTRTTQAAKTTPQFKTLHARRRRAEAEIRAVDAQRAAQEATAEAEHAEREAAQEQAAVRMAELSAELDRLDRYVQEQREREYREWHEAYDRRQAATEQLRALADEPLPHVPMTREEQQELLAELDAAVAASEHEREGLFYHAGRLWDRSRFY